MLPESPGGVNADVAQAALTPETLQAIIVQTVAVLKGVDGQTSPCKEAASMSSAWVRQRPEQVKKMGAKAPWYCNWYDPDGVKRRKSCGPGEAGRKLANQLKRQVEAQITLGTYELNANKCWEEFRAEYEGKILDAKSPSTRRQVRMSFANFERIVRPKKVSAIKTVTIDQFIATRRQEFKRYSDKQTVSQASVNADLRNLKAALSVAREWGYLKEEPVFRMLKEPRKLPVYVLPEHFALIYAACDAARLPVCQGFTAADWWRGLLVFIYQATGWRIGQALALERADLDLTAGTAIARAVVEGNKAKADRLVKLHPLAVEHLRRLAGFTPTVFPWPHDRRTLTDELHRVCRAAGTPAYGFHAFRKGFGTLNAPRLSATELQHLMQHASLATTQRYYVNPTAAQDEAVGKLYVPDVLKGKTG